MEAIDLTSQPSEDSMDVMIAADMVIHEVHEETEHDSNDDLLEEEEIYDLDDGESYHSEEEIEDLTEEIISPTHSLDELQTENDGQHGKEGEHLADGNDGKGDEIEAEDKENESCDQVDCEDPNEPLAEEDLKEAWELEKPIDCEKSVVTERMDPEPSYQAVSYDEGDEPIGVEILEKLPGEELPSERESASDSLPVRTSSPVPPPPIDMCSPDEPLKKSLSPIVHAKGLAFDTSEPWQRSLLRELERKKVDREPATGTRPTQQPVKHGRMLVGHTESRDFAIEMCDSGTFSLMSDTSSVAPPAHSQLIHRSREYRDEDIFVEDEEHYEHPTPKSTDRKGASGHSSPRSLCDELRQATHAKGRSPYSDQWLEIEQSEMEEEYSRYTDHNDDATAVTYGTADGQQEACYCLGYNVMDMILPPQRPPKSRGLRSRRRLHMPSTRLSRVQEDSNEQDYNVSSKDSHRFGRQETPESRSGQESAYRSRSIRQTQSRDPDGAYLDHYHVS